MGGKKRTSRPDESIQPESSDSSDDESSSPAVQKTVKPEEKTKKKKKKKASLPDEPSEPDSGVGADLEAAAPAAQKSIKPMERRKKRKAEDKARHAAEMEKSQKPKTESTAVLSGGQVLPSVHSGGLPVHLFMDLTSLESSVRETAADDLAAELLRSQDEFERSGGENRESGTGAVPLEAEKNDGLDNCAPPVRYAVRRLIRGLASSRECARQGFALGLAVVVSKLPAVSMDSIMKLVAQFLEVSSSKKGQEVRDNLIGRLFAYGALARSGRVASELASQGNPNFIKEILNQITSLAGKKRYLREPAVFVILDLVKELPVEVTMEHVVSNNGVHEWFDKAHEVGDPDALLLALKLQEKAPTRRLGFGKLLPHPFSANAFFSREHLSLLLPCFKESTFCLPRVHSIWHVIIDLLIPSVSSRDNDSSSVPHLSKKQKRARKTNTSEEIIKNFSTFREVVIEGSLLSSSHERKHLVFDLLFLLLPKLPKTCIEDILSHKLVHCLMDILSTKSSWLYSAAQNVIRELVKWVSNNDDHRVAVILSIAKHSNCRFDCITQSNTVKDLISGFSTCTGRLLLAQNLMSLFVDENETADEPSDASQTTDENSERDFPEDKDPSGTLGNTDFLKNWVIESLPRVLKTFRVNAAANTPDPEETVKFVEEKYRLQADITKFLAVQGLFSASLGTEVTSFELQEKFTWPKASTSSSLCRVCIQQLQLLIEDAQKGNDSKDLGSFLVSFLNTMRNIPSVSLFRALSDEEDKAFKNLLSMTTLLHQEERKIGAGIEANKMHMMRYLLIQVLLQLVLCPQKLSESAEELIICCKKAFPALTENESVDRDEEPELMDVLMDILLSLLPQSSGSMCYAIEQVFRYFCDGVTDDGLTRMLHIVKKDLKPPRRQVAEAESDDDDDDYDDGDDEDIIEIEDAEEVIETKSLESDGDDDNDDDSVDDATNETNDASLATEAYESDMDDDAMFLMDSYIAQLLKERKESSGGGTTQSQLSLFKLRVLSLLEIFLHRNPGDPRVVTVYSSLIQAFVNSHSSDGNKQLGERISGILQKKIFKGKDFPKGSDVAMSTLEALLGKSLRLAFRSRVKPISSVAENSAFWLLKIINSGGFSASELVPVFDLLRLLLDNYFDNKKSRLKSTFIKEVFRRHPWVSRQLFDLLLEKCTGAKSEFRRIEALELVDFSLKLIISPALTSDDGSAAKFLKKHVAAFSELVCQLLSRFPEKQSRRAEVRRFCGRILEALTSHNLVKSFVKQLTPEGYSACETKLGNQFLMLKKSVK